MITDEQRQKKLYNFLRRQGNCFTLQQTIANALPKCYPYDSTYDFHNSRARLMMSKDIQIINDSLDYEKIIISSQQGIKLATKKEFKEYMRGQYAAIFARLKRARKKEEKGNRDGQSVLGGFDSMQIDSIIEAFIEEDE